MVLPKYAVKMRSLLVVHIVLLTMTAHSFHYAVDAVRNAKTAESSTPLQGWEKKIQASLKNREKFSKQLEEVRSVLNKLESDIARLKRRLLDRNDRSNKQPNDFSNTLYSILGQQHATLGEGVNILQHIISQIDRGVNLLQEQESTDGQQHQRLASSATNYSYEGIKIISQQLVELQALRSEEEKNRSTTNDELVKRRKAQVLAEEEYENKKQDLETSITNTTKTQTVDRGNGFTVSQKIEILQAEERLAWYRCELAIAKVHEAEQRIYWLDLSLANLKSRLAEANKEFARMKRGVHVDAEYVNTIAKELEQHRQVTSIEREKINDSLRIVSELELQLQHKIHDSQESFGLAPADVALIRTYNKEVRSIRDWEAFTEIAHLIIDESLINIERDVLVAKIELAKSQLRKDEINLQIIKSWHRMTNREARFRTDDEVDQESKLYSVLKSELEGQAASFINAREVAMSRLLQYNLNLDKLKSMIDELQRQKLTLFRADSHTYNMTLDRMDQLSEKIRRYFHWIGSLIEVYSTDIAVVNNTLRMVESVMRELTSKSFWKRSDLSLDWSDLKDFLPSMRVFLQDLGESTRQFFTTERIGSILKVINEFIHQPLRILLCIINIILCITVYFLLKTYLPELIAFMSGVGQGYLFIHTICIAIAALLAFTYQHLKSMYIWIVCFSLIKFSIIRDSYIVQLFYLITIPYALWLLYCMIQHWIAVNQEKKYVLVTEKYQKRFFGIISIMGSVVIVLSCLREAYFAGGYQQSTLPTILFAVMFILGQISAIGLIGRAQILSLVRSDTPMWQWIYEHVMNYYYLVWVTMIGIIIMCNPYVGYGRQVLYVVVRLALTLVLVPLLSWIHNTVKNISIDLFFYQADRDIVKERFAASRIWYSVFVTVSLVIFLVTAIYICAHLWGYHLTLRNMVGWLEHPFYTQEDAAGNIRDINTFSLLKIALYFIAGFVVAHVFNNLVVARVLDPFIVDSGIQNTVMTLLHYLIITIAVFMGVASAGLEGLTTKLAIIMAGLGFATADAIKDFLSYFILLVQRPVKVGDFIRILDGLSTEESVSLTGFVRSITPRSIVIRKRNSTTVVIPNSRVVQNPVMNWTYTRGFFAFEDMFITVPYVSDPLFVRQLFLGVLEKNPNILKNPAPIVRLEGFVDNGYHFLLRGYLTSSKIGDQWDIASDVRLQLVKALHEHNIEVASPIRTLRMLPQHESFLVDDKKEESADTSDRK